MVYTTLLIIYFYSTFPIVAGVRLVPTQRKSRRLSYRVITDKGFTPAVTIQSF